MLMQLYILDSSGLEVTAQAGITGREEFHGANFMPKLNNRNHFNVRMKSGNLTVIIVFQKAIVLSGEMIFYYRTTPRTTFKNTTDYSESHVSAQYDLTFDAINTSFGGVEHKMGKFNSLACRCSPETQSKGGIFGRNDATGSEFRVYGTYFQSRTAISDNVH